MSQDTLNRVVDCLETITRYPKQLLTDDAEIENGLGIDSVKFVEIILALSEEFDLELQVQQRDPSIKTIGQLADWIDGLLSGSAPSAPAPPATAPPSDRPAVNGQPEPSNSAPPATRLDPPQQGAPPRAAGAMAPQPNGGNGADRNGAHHNGADRNESNGTHRNGSHAANGTHRSANEPTPATQTRSLEGRVALVTGSGRGVGRTIARVLASRGATVLVNSFHSRDQGEETVADIRAAGGSAEHLWGSVANPDHVDEMFDRIQEAYGLDILVCNASDGRIGSFSDITPDDWDRAFRTNVSGHHRCAVHAARLMRERGGGSIVTMSAVGAHQFIDGLGAQGVAKAAVESMTRYLAYEFGGYGIRANCVAGGPVYGDLLSKFPAARATQDYWESIVPDGQLCSPLDLAQTIAYLVSDEARCVNGAVWMVDHGFSANADGQRRRRVSREAVLSPVS